MNILKTLTEAGLLKKHDIYKDGQHFCEYRAIAHPCKNCIPPM